ncbi:LPS export ABC transporter periplasmic protein LptC [Dyella psychrodurans]|uniref:LPS export ABC transporter periplasmic protein LptC n=1 Tax=Dyella psychrodurans TaxID=1927960 RepID=A0A370X207_9GAMM|nr:LPS export ABC transporter periplasmic protein LptC [Dyella psychrodurans]RDS82433.1 LPS export ABC transporter periplasmic protein LptC [Dyella psychrodurans]
MNFRQYLRDNRTTVAIVILAIAAPASWMLQRWVAGTTPVNDFVGPPIADYVLYNSTVWSYDVNGLLSFTMSAPRMDRRAGDESMYINTPVFDIKSKKPGVPDWHGNAPFGWVNKSGTLMQLNGPVYMQRPAFKQSATGVLSPMATLCTSNVTGWPKENRIQTADPAVMTQGASVMNGVGMRASLNDNHLELLNDVHGLLYSSQNNAAAKPVDCRSLAPAASIGKAG